jgi:hypothetical protein
MVRTSPGLSYIGRTPSASRAKVNPQYLKEEDSLQLVMVAAKCFFKAK